MRRNNSIIGLDLGDRRHHVCVLNGSGKIVAEEVIPNARETLLVLSARFPQATFIMETGTHSPLGEPIFAGRTTPGWWWPTRASSARFARRSAHQGGHGDDDDLGQHAFHLTPPTQELVGVERALTALAAAGVRAGMFPAEGAHAVNARGAVSAFRRHRFRPGGNCTGRMAWADYFRPDS